MRNSETMKYTILFSLLLVGVCFGSTLEHRRYAYDGIELLRDGNKMNTEENSGRGRDWRDATTLEEDAKKQNYDSQRQSFDSQKQSLDSQRQSYDSQKQREDTWEQGYDSQRRNYDSQSRNYNSEKQTLNTQRQDYNSQKQSVDSQIQDLNSQKQSVDSQRQDFNSQKQSVDSQRQDFNSQKQSVDSQRQDFNSQRQSFDSQRQDLNSQREPSHFMRQDFIYPKQEDFWKQGVRTNTNFGWEEKLDQSQNKDDRSRGESNIEKEEKLQRMLYHNKRPQAFLGLGELGRKIGDYIRGIFGHGSNSQVAKVYSDEVPSFEDPLLMSDLDTTFALINTKYYQIHFYGLRKAYQIIMYVDTQNHQIEAQIPLKNVELKGQYTYSSRPAHNFTIVLSDAVFVQTVPYTLKGNEVQLGDSSAQVQYSKESSIYDRIGFIAQVLQGQLGKHLVSSVTPQLLKYISPKLDNLLTRTVLDVTSNLQRAHIVSGLQEGIEEAVKKIQADLAGNISASIELSSQKSPEYQYQHYRAQIVSVSLQNVQNLTMLQNKVTFTDTMVHSHVNLSLSQPIVSAVISYHSHQDSQNYDMHVQYMVDSIQAKLELHKDLNKGQLQLASVKVIVSQPSLAPSQGHYKGDLAGLVNLIGSKLQHFVSQSLEDTLQSQVSGILAKVDYGENMQSNSAMSEKVQHSENEKSGSGHSDMGQYGSQKSSDREYSGDNRQKYPGTLSYA